MPAQIGPVIFQVTVPDGEGCPQRPPGIACSGLDPNILKRTFPQHMAVRHAVKGYAACKAKVFLSGFSVNGFYHSKDNLFGHDLDARRYVHFPLSNLGFRSSGGASKEL